MNFKEDDYILGMWFASDDENNDFLLTVKKNQSGWEGEYRFRYGKKEEKEKDPFVEDSEKSFYSFTTSGSEESIIEKIGKMISIIALKYPNVSILPVKGNVKKFIEVAKDVPWIHLKTISET
jgi:hypothetical protein